MSEVTSAAVPSPVGKIYTAPTPARAGLDSLFLPRSAAVIGATDRAGTVGRSVVSNLLQSKFPIKVYAVNPSHGEVLGIKTHKRIGEIAGGVDLALVVTPAQTVPQIIGECVDAGVKSAVVISAGFREQGHDGAVLEDEIRKHLDRGSLRLIGPNCMGFMNPTIGLNATFAKSMPQKGSVAFLSQSGALLTSILDWSQREQVGFSAIVSTGSMLDVGWGDLIYHFGDDPHTKSILLYMESVGDARSFLSAAREIALSKPIIVIKAGRSEAASRAAASHTGALTGSDDVLDAAFRRCGVLRVQNLADLFYMAEVLSKQPRPRGPRLTIVTNAGGPGVLATDSLMATGGELTVLSKDSVRELDSFLSAHWSHSNPVDVLADADAERFVKAVDIASKDPDSDGLLAIIAPQGLAESHASGGADEAARALHGQAAAGELDGRRRRGRGDCDPEHGGHSNVFVSRHRGARLHLHVALHLQPARAVRNAGAGGRNGSRCRGAHQGQPNSCSRCAPAAGRCSTNLRRNSFSPTTEFRWSTRASRKTRSRRSLVPRRSGIRWC